MRSWLPFGRGTTPLAGIIVLSWLSLAGLDAYADVIQMDALVVTGTRIERTSWQSPVRTEWHPSTAVQAYLQAGHLDETVDSRYLSNTWDNHSKEETLSTMKPWNRPKTVLPSWIVWAMLRRAVKSC